MTTIQDSGGLENTPPTMSLFPTRVVAGSHQYDQFPKDVNSLIEITSRDILTRSGLVEKRAELLNTRQALVIAEKQSGSNRTLKDEFDAEFTQIDTELNNTEKDIESVSSRINLLQGQIHTLLSPSTTSEKLELKLSIMEHPDRVTTVGLCEQKKELIDLRAKLLEDAADDGTLMSDEFHDKMNEILAKLEGIDRRLDSQAEVPRAEPTTVPTSLLPPPPLNVDPSPPTTLSSPFTNIKTDQDAPLRPTSPPSGKKTNRFYRTIKNGVSKAMKQIEKTFPNSRSNKKS